MIIILFNLSILLNSLGRKNENRSVWKAINIANVVFQFFIMIIAAIVVLILVVA